MKKIFLVSVLILVLGFGCKKFEPTDGTPASTDTTPTNEPMTKEKFDTNDYLGEAEAELEMVGGIQ